MTRYQIEPQRVVVNQGDAGRAVCGSRGRVSQAPLVHPLNAKASKATLLVSVGLFAWIDLSFCPLLLLCNLFSGKRRGVFEICCPRWGFDVFTVLLFMFFSHIYLKILMLYCPLVMPSWPASGPCRPGLRTTLSYFINGSGQLVIFH